MVQFINAQIADSFLFDYETSALPHVGQTVWVRESETGLLQIEAEGQIVAEHRVLPGRHLVSANPEHTRGITPTASVTYGKIPGTQIGPEVEQRDLAIYEEIALGGRSH